MRWSGTFQDSRDAFGFFQLRVSQGEVHALTMIGSPAVRAGHNHDVAGTKDDGDRFDIAGWPTEQEDRGASDTVISGQCERGNGRAGIITILKPEGWQCKSLTGRRGP